MHCLLRPSLLLLLAVVSLAGPAVVDFAAYRHTPCDAPLLPPSRCLPVNANETRDGDSDGCSGSVLMKPGDFVVVDFGRTLAGHVTVEVTAYDDDTPSPVFLQMGYCESNHSLLSSGDALSQHPFDKADFYPTTSGPMHVAGGSVVAFNGGFSGAFRYAVVTLAEGGEVAIGRVNASVEMALATPCGSPYPGNLVLSDKQLTEIFYAGAFTQEISTGGVAGGGSIFPRQFIDGGKRDRAVWTADLWVQLLTTFASSMDVEGAKTALESLAMNQTDSGYIAHMSPVMGEDVKIGLHFAGALTFTEYQCWWVIASYEFYWRTGDVSWLNDMLPVADRAMAWLKKKAGSDGLITLSAGLGGLGGDGSPWHTPDSTSGAVTHVNSLAVMAIDRYIAWRAAAGADDDKEETAAAFHDWRDALVSQVNAQLFDDALGAFRNTDEAIGHPQVLVQDANAAAVMAGVADASRSARVLKTLEAELHTELGPATVDKEIMWPPSLFMFPYQSRYVSPYSTFLEIYARLTTTHDSEEVEIAVSLIRRMWGHMLSQADQGASTFWEKVAMDGGIEPYRQTKMPACYTSLAHGWSTGPVWALSDVFLGVRPTAAGYTSVNIEPSFGAGDVTWADGQVPTPFGASINVSWEWNSSTSWAMRVGLPEGVASAVCTLPNASTVSIAAVGSHQWSSLSSDD